MPIGSRNSSLRTSPGCMFFNCAILMIVYDLNLFGCVLLPFEDDSPLLVDANTVKVRPISTQFLQSVGRWNSKVVDILSVVQHSQFSSGNILNLRGQFSRTCTVPNFLGFLIAKTCDHSIDTPCVTNAKDNYNIGIIQSSPNACS